MLKPETEQIEKEKKPRDSIKMPEDKIEKLSEALKGDWKKLATQLGFTPKEVSIAKIFHANVRNNNIVNQINEIGNYFLFLDFIFRWQINQV